MLLRKIELLVSRVTFRSKDVAPDASQYLELAEGLKPLYRVSDVGFENARQGRF